MNETDGIVRVNGVITGVERVLPPKTEPQPSVPIIVATTSPTVKPVGRFKAGTSGNPNGRPKGSKSKTSVILSEWFDSTVKDLKHQDVPNPLTLFASFMMDETKNDKIRLAAAIEFGKYVLPRPEPEQKVVHEHYNVPETKEQLMLRLQEIYNTFNAPKQLDGPDGDGDGQ